MFQKIPEGEPNEEHAMLKYLLNSMLPSEQEMMRQKNKLDGFSDEEMLKMELEKMAKEEKIFGVTKQIKALQEFDRKLRESTEGGPTPEQQRQGLSSVLDVIPGVGDVKSGVEAWTGKDPVTGDKLPGWARGLAALGALPLIPSLVYAGKMARGAKLPKGGVAKTLESLTDADLVEVTGKGDKVRKWVPKGKVEGTGTELGQWWRGEDGGWRFEIDDSKASLNMLNIPDGNSTTTVGDILNHPRLYKAYPEIKNKPVILDIGDSVPNHGKLIGGKDNFISISGQKENVKETLIHEVQHAVQEIEGFAKGGSPALGISSEGQKILDEWSKPIKAKIEQARKAGDISEVDRLRQELYELPTKAEFEAYRNLPGERESREVGRRAVRK
uniref:Putative pre-toxin TG domain contining protein n=1 Tax=viral metagenome TaxID=1070528 RepID=A0A6M3KFK3_9ZZZZ